jgi:hypothetical protein
MSEVMDKAGNIYILNPDLTRTIYQLPIRVLDLLCITS